VKILVLTFYYPPDLSAGSFRIVSVVNALRQQNPGAEIDIVTTRPNRYGSFAADAPRNESLPGIRISRIPVSKHKSGMLDQSRAFAKFAFSALREIRGRRYDIVIATSSRLMTGFLGAVAARRTGAKFYLDIRDIFADTIGEIAAKPVAMLARPFFSLVERWTVGTADTVSLVSPGFETYFRKRYPRKRLVFFTNGVDDEFVRASSRAAATERHGKHVTILYAGNIGEGQGLETVLPDMAQRLGERATIRVIGDGGRKEVLREAVEKRGLTNVEMLSPMHRDELIRAYAEADVLFLHLNTYPALLKVLPSKVFEYAATGKPILAGVSGFAASFLAKEVSNAAIFKPCDVNAAIAGLDTLEIREISRDAFVTRFLRSRISADMAADILSVAAGKAAA
jgi:glycosyltransferase involved in cell wall biosynthesis